MPPVCHIRYRMSLYLCAGVYFVSGGMVFISCRIACQLFRRSDSISANEASKCLRNLEVMPATEGDRFPILAGNLAVRRERFTQSAFHSVWMKKT